MSQLHVAASLGDVEGIDEMLLHHPDEMETLINSQDHLLWKTPLHLAAEFGHWNAVQQLSNTKSLNFNLADLNGATVLHVLLERAEKELRPPNSQMTHIINALFLSCDVEKLDASGRSVLSLGRASRWPEIRDTFSKEVIKRITELKPFEVVDFMAVWINEKEHANLEVQLFKSIEKLFTRPIDKHKNDYCLAMIFPLPIWMEHTFFQRLKDVAQQCSNKIIQEAHDVRDKVITSGKGPMIVNLASFGDLNKVANTSLPPEMLSLGASTPGWDRKQELEETVFVPLLRLRADQLYEEFEQKLLDTLPGAALHSNTDIVEDNPSFQGHPRKIIMAGVKGPMRMKAKLREYYDSYFEAGAGDATPWPLIRKLGDCLRCTVECATMDDVWESYKQIEEAFALDKNRGRLKNRMPTDILQPPDMLVNAIFKSDSGVEMMTEIQIHLEEIHALKQEEHLAYKVSRATCAEDLISDINQGSRQASRDHRPGRESSGYEAPKLYRKRSSYSRSLPSGAQELMTLRAEMHTLREQHKLQLEQKEEELQQLRRGGPSPSVSTPKAPTPESASAEGTSARSKERSLPTSQSSTTTRTARPDKSRAVQNTAPMVAPQSRAGTPAAVTAVKSTPAPVKTPRGKAAPTRNAPATKATVSSMDESPRSNPLKARVPSLPADRRASSDVPARMSPSTGAAANRRASTHVSARRKSPTTSADASQRLSTDTATGSRWACNVCKSENLPASAKCRLCGATPGAAAKVGHPANILSPALSFILFFTTHGCFYSKPWVIRRPCLPMHLFVCALIRVLLVCIHVRSLPCSETIHRPESSRTCPRGPKGTPRQSTESIKRKHVIHLVEHALLFAVECVCMWQVTAYPRRISSERDT